MDLLIPNMFLTLYLGLNVHHLHRRAVTGLSELYRQAGNAFPLPHCSPCQMWSCEDKAARTSLDRHDLPFGGVLLTPLRAGARRAQHGRAPSSSCVPRNRSPVTCSLGEKVIFLLTDAQRLVLSPAKACPIRILTDSPPMPAALVRQLTSAG